MCYPDCNECEQALLRTNQEVRQASYPPSMLQVTGTLIIRTEGASVGAMYVNRFENLGRLYIVDT